MLTNEAEHEKKSEDMTSRLTNSQGVTGRGRLKAAHQRGEKALLSYKTKDISTLHRKRTVRKTLLKIDDSSVSSRFLFIIFYIFRRSVQSNALNPRTASRGVSSMIHLRRLCYHSLFPFI